MNITDLKTQLTNRQATLDAQTKRAFSNVLMAEERVRDARAELAATQGARDEVAAMLAFVDQPSTDGKTAAK